MRVHITTVHITTNKITPGLRRKISDHVGQDISQYPALRIDLTRVPLALSQALEDASKVPDSGVVEFAPKNVGKPPSVPEVKPKEEPKLVLDEGGRRLQYHVRVNGLLPVENNILAIKDWFARHPEEKFDKDTVDRVVFKEIEEELLWEPGNANHEFWAARFNPPPPKPAPPPEPPKPKKLGRLPSHTRTALGHHKNVCPDGERRLPIPSTAAELANASLAQVEDYRDRLRRGEGPSSNSAGSV